MMKITLVAVALMLPVLAGATTPTPAPAAPAPTTAAPQSTQHTSRSQALKLMAACQKKAKNLKGAEKEKAIQACMRSAP
jgi:hypothetical protein